MPTPYLRGPMKKVYPLIIFLITFSVLGILYIQMSWIKNALYVKQEEYYNDLKRALVDIRVAAHNSFVNSQGFNPDQLDEENKEFLLTTRFTAQSIPTDEMNMIVVQAMKSHNIKVPFEFCVTNMFNNPITSSAGFKNNMFFESTPIRITPEASVQPETFFLYVKEPQNYIMRQMASGA